MQNCKMWINGKWVESLSGKTYTVVNPTTEEELARIPLGSKADVDKAVEAARKAFPVWYSKPQAERSKIVSQLAILLKENVNELARLEILEHGTLIVGAPLMVGFAAALIEHAASASRTLMGDVISPLPNTMSYLKREPVGVCALITPWNVPLMMMAAKLGPALAAGNTCIVKPPSINSLIAIKLAEIFEKMNLPPGTVNVVTGPGSTVGTALASHPDVNLIAFTGSCDTGKEIMGLASRTMKRLQMELGGKNPVIVLEDADVDTAVSRLVMQQTNNSGQVCASPGRYYIHEKVYDEFVEKFINGMKIVVVGDPSDEKTQMGPLVSAEHRDRVEAYIKSGIDEGAKLVLGGKRPTQPPLNKGYYVMPTVFTNVKQDMTIAREEIFGPVACIMEKFSSDDEVIKLANDNTFGLCAYVWTRDTGKSIRFANELCAGTIWLNNSGGLGPELPWGGFKESGIGKEGSLIGLQEFTQLKMIGVDLTPTIK